MEEVVLYKFQLETIKEALRIASNALHSERLETCLDRQVGQALRYAENGLKGNKDERVVYGSK